MKGSKNMRRIKKSVLISLISSISVLSYLDEALLQAQSLEVLLSEVAEQNTELKALQLEYEAALQKAPQVTQLPNTQYGMGVPVLRPETRLGGQVVAIGASQMFPWFGTLKAKEDVVLTMAKSKYERIAAIKLGLVYQVKSAYYKLYMIDEKQKTIQENLKILEGLDGVALAKIENGKASPADVLRIKLRTEELLTETKMLDLQKESLYYTLNEIRNQPLDQNIVISGNYDSVAEIDFDFDAYRLKIQQFHPLIAQLNDQMETSNKELALNALSGKPSFGFGLDYNMVNIRTDAFPDGNGRDILIPKLMVSMPINRKQSRAKVEEEKLNQAAIEYRKVNLEKRFMTQLEQYKAEYAEVMLKIQLIGQQMKIAQAAYEILLSAYSTSGARFDELMAFQNMLLKYKLDLVEAKVATYQIQAKVDSITDF